MGDYQKKIAVCLYKELDLLLLNLSGSASDLVTIEVLYRQVMQESILGPF